MSAQVLTFPSARARKPAPRVEPACEFAARVRATGPARLKKLSDETLMAIYDAIAERWQSNSLDS